MTKFRFNASKVFLTYSQVTRKFNPQLVLSRISAKAGVEEYLIAQERHKDGGYHIHAYFKFDKKLDYSSESCFDIKYWNVSHHPNIQKPKSRYKLFRYIKKDGNYITNIEETRPKWLQLVEDTSDKAEFLTELMWHINRIDNYAGYRTLRDLYDHIEIQKHNGPGKTTIEDYMKDKK